MEPKLTVPVEIPFAQYCKYSLVYIFPRETMSCNGCVIGLSSYSNLVNLIQSPISVGKIETKYKSQTLQNN